MDLKAAATMSAVSTRPADSCKLFQGGRMHLAGATPLVHTSCERHAHRFLIHLPLRYAGPSFESHTGGRPGATAGHSSMVV
jgi:hypothetical protein